MPEAKLLTANWAELPDNIALPREVDPSINVTLPVAVVPDGG